MTTNEMKKRLVPRLRFPDFEDMGGWDSKELGKIATLITEKAGNNRYTLMSVTAGVGLVTQIEKFGKEIAGEAYKNYYVIRKGDFAYNKSSTKQHPEGQMALLEVDQGAVPNSIFTCFRVYREFVSPYFLKYLFATNVHGKWLRNFIAIGARANGALNVDSKDLLTLPIVFPSLEEQEKIANCLASIDELIVAQGEKVAALQAHKKGLMQKLFPREGETTPRLRFPAFRDAAKWEEISLGSIGKVSMCKRILKEETKPNGDIPFYKIGTFGKQADAYISREIYENYKSNYPHPKKGDILISAAGTIGRLVVFDGEDAYFQDSNIVWIDNNESLIKNVFLFYCYTRIKWVTDDNTIPRLYNDNLKGVKIAITSIPEQQKIADCLSSIDELISTHSQKLETLKTHKKSLMQQLFPSADNDGTA